MQAESGRNAGVSEIGAGVLAQIHRGPTRSHWLLRNWNTVHSSKRRIAIFFLWIWVFVDGILKFSRRLKKNGDVRKAGTDPSSRKGKLYCWRKTIATGRLARCVSCLGQVFRFENDEQTPGRIARHCPHVLYIRDRLPTNAD